MMSREIKWAKCRKCGVSVDRSQRGMHEEFCRGDYEKLEREIKRLRKQIAARRPDPEAVMIPISKDPQTQNQVAGICLSREAERHIANSEAVMLREALTTARPYIERVALGDGTMAEAVCAEATLNAIDAALNPSPALVSDGRDREA